MGVGGRYMSPQYHCHALQRVTSVRLPPVLSSQGRQARNLGGLDAAVQHWPRCKH